MARTSGTRKHSLSDSSASEATKKKNKRKKQKKGKGSATTPQTPAPVNDDNLDEQDDITGQKELERQQAEAKRRQEVVLAITQNPPGVRVLKQKQFRDGGPALAGYLGLGSTADLREFLFAGRTCNRILIPWKEARDRNFGTTENTQVSAKNLLELINAGDTYFERHHFDDQVPLPREKWRYTDRNRALASWIITMYHLVRTNHHMFPTTFMASEEEKEKYVMGIMPEDWFRAYWILAVFHRLLTPSKTKTDKEDNGEKSEKTLSDLISEARGSLKTSKKQNRRAIPPEFYTDEEYESIKTGNHRPLLPMGDVNQFDYLQDALVGEDSDAETDSGAPITDERARAITDNTEAQLLEMAAKSAPTTTVKMNVDKVFAPWPNEDVMATTCLSQGRKVKVLWPEGDDNPNSQSEDPEVNTFINRNERNFEAEGVLGPAEEVDQQKQRDFWQLQTTINNRSAKPKPYTTACQYLDVEPDACVLRNGDGVSLYPWQAQGIVWLLEMLKSELKCGFLADDVGLGKTITALATLSVGVDAAKRNLRDNSHHMSPMGKIALEGPYFPTIILCPSNALQVWQKEIEENFPEMTLFKYFGDPKKKDPKDKSKILPKSIEKVTDWVDEFETTDPATALNIVLTSYATWHRRTLTIEADPDGNSRRDSVDERFDESDDEDGDNELIPVEQLSRVTSKAKHLFNFFIFDEAHKLKSTRTRTHLSVVRAKPTRILPMTATLTINKPADLYGLLCLMEAVRPPGLPIEGGTELADFDEAMEEIDLVKVGFLPWFDCYFNILSSTVFRKHIKASKNIRTDVASRLLPLIYTLIVLRRVKGQEIDLGHKKIIIGQDVPRYNIQTVELAMNKAQQRLYSRAHQRYCHALGRGNLIRSGNPTENGKVDLASHRFLCHATMDPELDNFATKTTTVKNMDAWHEKGDHGCTYYHSRTRKNTNVPPYLARQAVVCYNVAQSAKMKWLLSKAFEVCITKKNKLLIFCNWPLNQWYVEMCLVIAGFKVLSVRSAHTVYERNATISAFNNIGDDSQILVTSYRCSATSLNLQKACWHMVMVDVPESANTAMQAIGRIFRIHQKHEQYVWILTVDHTYDQVIQARSANKMYGQIAGSATLDSDNGETSYEASPSDNGDTQDKSTRTKENQVIRLYMAMLGQRSPRHKWTDALNLTAKDQLPDEVEFYRSLDSRNQSERMKVKEQLDRERKKKEGKGKEPATGRESPKKG